MGREHSSGQQFLVGDRIKGYEILKVFDPGGFAFAGKARAANGRNVFFKKYKRPGASSAWLGGFVAYQGELKNRIQGSPASKSMCYEFVEFFDVSLSGGRVPLRAFYQVFEWIEGGSSLRGLLDRTGKKAAEVSWDQKVLFAKMLAAGINAIHRVGVIHADLKPENFYLIPDASLEARYKLRVIDMDFSILEGRRAPWHGHEGYVGTEGYMSPEHLDGRVPEKASDSFTCGLILSELLCGVHPAADFLADAESYAGAVRGGRLKPIEIREPIAKVADLRFLNAVLNGCFRPEPLARPTMEQVLKALNGVLDSWDGMKPASSPLLVEPPRPAPKPPPPPPPTAEPRSEAPPHVEPPAAGSAERPRRAGATEGAAVQIASAKGQIEVRIPTTLGRAQFRRWGEEFERFMSDEQFRLSRDGDSGWLIEHVPGATNATNVDGAPLMGAVRVGSGMQVSLGRSGKCAMTLKLVD